MIYLLVAGATLSERGKDGESGRERARERKGEGERERKRKRERNVSREEVSENCLCAT